MKARRESGALLLTVSLLLAMMAALAFGLNRAGGMDVNAVATDYDQRNAAYLAEAAVAAAKWTNQVNKCGKASIPAFSFGGGTTAATVTQGGSKRINVVASATTAAGTAATLTRKEVDIVNFASLETKDLGGAVQDTTVDRTVLLPMNISSDLSLVSGQSNVLMSWATTDIPADAEVMAASLILTQNGSGASARTVSVHRITTQWDPTATWLGPRLLVSWSGGDYSPVTIATADVGAQATTTTWNVTSLVDGWASKRLANYGMLLRLPNPGQSATFYSMENVVSLRPVLRVTFAKPC